MLNEKATIIHLIVALIKKDLYTLYKTSYFPEPFDYTLNKVRVELNWLNMTQEQI